MRDLQVGFLGRGLSESRIVADYTDCADFKDFCLPSVLVRITGVWVLRSEDANWKVSVQKKVGIGARSYKDREPSSLLQKIVRKRRESEFPPTKMDLAPEQYFVYAWRYMDDAVCKLGVEYAPKLFMRVSRRRRLSLIRILNCLG